MMPTRFTVAAVIQYIGLKVTIRNLAVFSWFETAYAESANRNAL